MICKQWRVATGLAKTRCCPCSCSVRKPASVETREELSNRSAEANMCVSCSPFSFFVHSLPTLLASWVAFKKLGGEARDFLAIRDCNLPM